MSNPISNTFNGLFRFWNRVIEKPKFWSWAQLLVNKYNYHEVLHSRRVNTVQKIKISVNACKDNTITNILENLLSAVLESRCHLLRLEVVRGKGSNLLVDLTSLDQELLSRTLVRLEEISFTDSICSPLSSEQLVSVFTAIEQTNKLKLRKLNFPNKDYSEVQPGVLASVLVKLEETNILEIPRVCQLSPEQVRSLFSKMGASPDINIKKINLRDLDCSDVEPELYSAALINIDTVWPDSEDGAEKVSSLFSKIAATDDLRLRELWLSQVDISHITPVIFSAAALKLAKLDAFQCSLTDDQLCGVFTQLSLSEHQRLRVLRLCDNDLSSVPPETLLAAISGLEEVALSNTGLTTEQLTAVSSQLSAVEHCRLTTLDLAFNNLSSVPVQMLAGVGSLKKLNLSNTNLTEVQLSSLFTELSDLEGGIERLRILNLSNNDLSSVPSQTLVSALSALEEVMLYNTKLIPDHLAGIRQISQREGGKCPVLRPASLRGNYRI